MFVVSGCQWPSSYAGRGTGLGALGGKAGIAAKAIALIEET